MTYRNAVIDTVMRLSMPKWMNLKKKRDTRKCVFLVMVLNWETDLLFGLIIQQVLHARVL